MRCRLQLLGVCTLCCVASGDPLSRNAWEPSEAHDDGDTLALVQGRVHRSLGTRVTSGRLREAERLKHRRAAAAATDILKYVGDVLPRVAERTGRIDAKQINMTVHGMAGLFLELVAWAENAYLAGIAEQVDSIRRDIASSEGLIWSALHSTITKSNLSNFESTMALTLGMHTEEWLNLTAMARGAASSITSGLQNVGLYDEAASVAADMGETLPHADAYIRMIATLERLVDGISEMEWDQQVSRLKEVSSQLQSGQTELTTFADRFMQTHQELLDRVSKAAMMPSLPKWSQNRILSAFGTVKEKADSIMGQVQKATQEFVDAMDGATAGSDFLPTTSTEPRELSWDQAAKIMPLPTKTFN